MTISRLIFDYTAAFLQPDKPSAVRILRKAAVTPDPGADIPYRHEMRVPGKLLLMLVSLQAAPLQAERLSDALSPQQQINIEFGWKYQNAGNELDAKDINTVIAHAHNVDTRLDTSDFVDTQARIFLELPVQVRGLNNPQRLTVSWTTNGLFQNGKVTPGNRRLVFEGKITQPVMRDIFNFTFEVDARFVTALLHLEPVYEIEIISP